MIVVRSNYGNESIALIQWCYENKLLNPGDITVCSIDTGWGAYRWHERLAAGQALAARYGFQTVHLKSPATMQALVLERGAFPSKKFQWCAGFLKGLAFIQWLDNLDPSCEAEIMIPKRQALYTQPIPTEIEACPHHGERKVTHPIIELSLEERDKLMSSAGFAVLAQQRSLECEPCIHSSKLDIAIMAAEDKKKTLDLEKRLKKPFFAQYNSLINEIDCKATKKSERQHQMDHFSMGCGDPFGCGL